MAIGITDEHEELRQAVRRFIDTRIDPSAPRAVLDADHDARPQFWDALREPGWLGLHVPEACGGAGYGLVEQAVVVEELGRACAPGPYVTTAIAAAVLSESLTTTGPGAGDVADLLSQLASGALTAAVQFSSGAPVICGALADLIVCEVDGTWAALDAKSIDITEAASVDRTRRVARISVD